MKVFIGPSYENLYRQLKSLRSHYLPIDFAWPYGIHICRYSTYGQQFYNESETKAELDHLLGNIDQIPFDSHCIDADLTAISSTTMENNGLDGYEDFVEKLREMGKKILIHVTLSAIEIVDETNQDNLFLKDLNDENYVGIYEKTRKLNFFDFITKSQEIADFLKL